MSIEDLMKPRYKVIAGFPMMEDVYKWKVGDVVQLVMKGMPIYFTADGGYIEEDFFYGYPNIFQKLEWWEERQPEEMPEYVKWIKGNGLEGNIEKVIGGAKRVDMVLLKVGSQVNNILPAYFIPATEEEYNTYINQQK